MSKRDSLILECRYYNGEKENPFEKVLLANEVHKSNLPPPDGMKTEYRLPPEEVRFLQSAATAWRCECSWVEESDKEDTRPSSEANMNYANDLEDFEPDDGTPIELKALLWNRHEHWTSGGWEDFKKWYLGCYQSLPTHRQRRAEERKKTLIPMCRYYKGEAECPRKFKEHVFLFWDYEKHWVEALSDSYSNGEVWRRTVEREHLEAFALKHNVPATLVGLLYNRFMHWSSGYETTEDFYKWMQDQYL